MMVETVFNSYLDLNIILIVAALMWAIIRLLLRVSVLRTAFPAQLKLVYAALAAVAATPLIAWGMNAFDKAGVFLPLKAPSLSDFALSHYLNGKFTMSPSQFEDILMARTVFTQDIASLSSLIAQIVVAIFATGLCLFAWRAARNALAVRRLIKQGYMLRKSGAVEILLSDKINVPFSTRGLTRHYIVIPSALLSQADDTKIAIAHEMQHMRQGDLNWEIILEFLKPLFFWNPAFWYFKHEVNALRELACDQRVIERRFYSVENYCGCLLRVCRNNLDKKNRQQIQVPGVAFAQAKARGNFLRFRVSSMLAPRISTPGRLLSTMLIIPVVCSIGFASIASQNSSDWSQDRLMLSTIVNLERLDQHNKTRQ